MRSAYTPDWTASPSMGLQQCWDQDMVDMVEHFQGLKRTMWASSWAMMVAMRSLLELEEKSLS